MLAGRIQNIGLQKRILVYVTLGLVLLVTLFTFIAFRAVNQSSEAVLEERLVLAQTVAKNLDALVHISISHLGKAVALLSANPLQDLSQHEERMLKTLSVDLGGGYTENLGIPAQAVLIDRDGQRVWSWNGTDYTETETQFLVQLAEQAASSGESSVKGLGPEDGLPRSVIALGVPVGEPTGEIRGALAAALIPNLDSLALFVSSEPLQDNYRVDLLDDQGLVIASSEQGNVLNPSRHLSIAAGVPVQSRTQGVWKHHSSSEGDADHIVALVPLEILPWTIALEQDEDVALASTRSLTRRILLLTILAVPAWLLMAWITTRQVVRPLARLTQTSGRIASGDLESPVSIEGMDEVGELARSFEVMRLRLKQSLDEIASWNQELEERVRIRTMELEQRSRERTQLLGKVITAQEEERKRVARDLHDMVGQALTGLGMALGSVETEMDGDPRRMRERLESLRSMTSATIEEVRHLIADLRPSLLDDLGLVHALGWYIETYLEKTGIRATLKTSGADKAAPPYIETTLFRVLQEAITNIIKHSHAQNVTIKLDFTGSAITAEVQDDGVGFNYGDTRRGVTSGHAVGLLGMEERVSLVGGAISISSEPGRGTTIVATIPIEQGETHIEG